MRLSVDAELPVDAATAWTQLVRWERQATWMPDADAVRVLGEAREGVGVRLAVRTRVLNVPAFTDVLEVVRWEPPRLLQVAHLGAVRGAAAWRLDPLAAGTTRFTWTEDVRVGGGPLGEVALLLYRPFLRRVLRRSVAGFAARLRRRS